MIKWIYPRLLILSKSDQLLELVTPYRIMSPLSLNFFFFFAMDFNVSCELSNSTHCLSQSAELHLCTAYCVSIACLSAMDDYRPDYRREFLI